MPIVTKIELSQKKRELQSIFSKYELSCKDVLIFGAISENTDIGIQDLNLIISTDHSAKEDLLLKYKANQEKISILTDEVRELFPNKTIHIITRELFQKEGITVGSLKLPFSEEEMQKYIGSMFTLEETIEKGGKLQSLCDQLIQEISGEKLVGIEQDYPVNQLNRTQRETLLKILAQQQLIQGSMINRVYGDNVLSHLPENFKVAIDYALKHEREIIENFLEIQEEDGGQYISVTFRHVPKSVSTDVKRLLQTFAYGLYTTEEKKIDSGVGMTFFNPL